MEMKELVNLTREDADLLELVVQAQVAQVAFSSTIMGADRDNMVDTVHQLEEIMRKIREGVGQDGKR